MAGEAAEVLASAQWRMAGVRDQAQQTLASLAGSRGDRAGLDDPAGTSGKETGFGRRFEVNIPITAPTTASASWSTSPPTSPTESSPPAPEA